MKALSLASAFDLLMASSLNPFTSGLLLLLLAVPLIMQTCRLMRRRRQQKEGDRKQVPQPRRWPLIGHLHLLRERPPVATICKELGRKMGTVVGLRFGRFPQLLVFDARLANQQPFESLYRLPGWRKLSGRSHAWCHAAPPSTGSNFRRKAAFDMMQNGGAMLEYSFFNNQAVELALMKLQETAERSKRGVVDVMDICGPVVCQIMISLCFGDQETFHRAEEIYQLMKKMTKVSSSGEGEFSCYPHWIPAPYMWYPLFCNLLLRQRAWNELVSHLCNKIKPLADNCYHRGRFLRSLYQVLLAKIHTNVDLDLQLPLGVGLDDKEQTKEIVEQVLLKASSDGKTCDNYPPRRRSVVSVVMDMLRQTEKLSFYLRPYVLAKEIDLMEPSCKDLELLSVDFLWASSLPIICTLEWAMAHLVIEPRLQEAIRSELDRVAGSSPFAEEQLQRLVYLEAIILETLRMHPPFHLLTHHNSSKMCHMGDFRLPHDTAVTYHLEAMGKDPEVWSHPQEFRPERFLDGDQLDESAVKRMLAFGVAGVHCHGRYLAITTLKVLIAKMVRRFEWATSVVGEFVPLIDEHKGSVVKLRDSLRAKITLRHNDPSLVTKGGEEPCL